MNKDTLYSIHTYVKLLKILFFCFLFFYFLWSFDRMREAARKIEERHFSNHATHVEFLPVEWRSKLTLDGGIF